MNVPVTINFDINRPVGHAEVSGQIDFDGDVLTVNMTITDPDVIALLIRPTLTHISIGTGLRLENPPAARSGG